MIRVFLVALIGASVLASVVHAPGLAVPLFIVILGLYVAGRMKGTIGPTKCPFCAKRVKLGANTCHHCGRDTIAGGAR